MAQRNIIYVDVSELHFDPHNPRFGMYHNAIEEKDIIQKMIDEESVYELVISIADQDYFPGEPLLVYEDEGEKMVAEGNRRLAALKILNSYFQNIPKNLQETVNNAQFKPSSVPCIIFNSRKDIIHYLGYRHITGVKSWGALEKAIYLKQLKDDLTNTYPNLLENELHTKLAREIGSRRNTVARSLAALGIYDSAKGSSKKFHDLQRVTVDEVDFSLIYTALGYENIWRFLGLDSSTDTNIDNIDQGHSKELFIWLFSEDENGNKVVRESRQLGNLSAVVGNQESIKVLRETHNLQFAYEFSDGPEEALNKLIHDTKIILMRLEDLVSSDTLTDINDNQIKDVRNFIDISEDIHRKARRKRTIEE